MTDSYIIENQAVPPGITKSDDNVFNEYLCWLPLISQLRYKMGRRHKLGATLLLSKFISKIFDDNKKEEDIMRQENSDKVMDTVLNLLNEKDVPLQPILEAGCGAAKYCSNNDLLLTSYFPILQANFRREDVQKNNSRKYIWNNN